MDKLPALPKLLDAPKSGPASLKFQIKSIVGVDKATTITVLGVGGEEITKTSAADASTNFEFADKSKGDIPIPASSTGFVRLTAKNAKDEVVGVSNVSVAEWLRYDNGSVVVPLATGKESAKDEKNGNKEGPSYYTTFRECKNDSSSNHAAGYVVVRYQFGKAKDSKKDAEQAPSTPVTASPEEAHRSGRSSVIATVGGTPLGGPDAVVLRLRMAAASGLLTGGGSTQVKDAVLEVFGPRPEAGKKKSTAPRVLGGGDEKESHVNLNNKGLRATKTGPATVGKNSKGDVKYSWRASDVKTVAMMHIDPSADSSSVVRIHAYEGLPSVTASNSERDKLFIGEATTTISEILSSAAAGSIKLKFEPRKDESVARVKDASGKLGQLLIDATVTPSSREVGSFVAPDGAYTHLRLQVTRCEGLKAGDVAGNSSDPLAIVKVNGKEIFKSPEISNTLYPMWGGDACCLLPIETLGGGAAIEIEIRDKDVVSSEFLGKTAFVPTGAAGSVLLPLTDNKGVVPTDKPLGTVTITWLFEMIREKDEARPTSPEAGSASKHENVAESSLVSASPSSPLSPPVPVAARTASVLKPQDPNPTPAPIRAPVAQEAPRAPSPDTAAPIPTAAVGTQPIVATTNEQLAGQREDPNIVRAPSTAAVAPRIPSRAPTPALVQQTTSLHVVSQPQLAEVQPQPHNLASVPVPAETVRPTPAVHKEDAIAKSVNTSTAVQHPIPASAPIYLNRSSASDQNPAGLVADFLKEAKPSDDQKEQDQYTAAAAYGVQRTVSSGAPAAALLSPAPTQPYAASPPKKVPITVPALLKLRGVDLEMLEAVSRPNQIKFLQAVLRDVADHLLLDPVQLSIVNVGSAHGMLIDFKFQLTEDQARRNIMDAYVQKTLAGMLSMRYANTAYVDYLGGRPAIDPRAPAIVAETAATFGEFRTTPEAAPRLEINPVPESSPNRSVASPHATRGMPRPAAPSITNHPHHSNGSSSPTFARGPHNAAVAAAPSSYYPSRTESFPKAYNDQMYISPSHRIVNSATPNRNPAPYQMPFQTPANYDSHRPYHSSSNSAYANAAGGDQSVQPTASGGGPFAVGTPRQMGSSATAPHPHRAPSPHYAATNNSGHYSNASPPQQYRGVESARGLSSHDALPFTYPQHHQSPNHPHEQYRTSQPRPPSPAARGGGGFVVGRSSSSQGSYSLQPQQRQQPVGGLLQGFGGGQQQQQQHAGMLSANLR